MGPREIAGRHDVRPKVSVAIVTYNHGAFIAEAIDSVLRQETPFDLEVVIGEDCSTDGTREIVESYAGRDRRIRLLLHPHRLGPHEPYLEGKNNFLATYRACRGEYVAFLDGDDCWTDTAKLCKQVELLDAHRDFAFCYHPVAVEYLDGRVRHWPQVAGTSTKSVWTLEEVLRLETKPEMLMTSMMIRADLLPDFPPWFQEVVNGDYALQVLLARHGGIAFLPDCMAVHRKHGGGISRIYDEDPDHSNRMLLKLHVALNKELGFRFRDILGPYIEHESRLVAARHRLRFRVDWFTRSETRRRPDVMLRIPNLTEAAQLIVQSWGAPEPATVYIEGIDLLAYTNHSPLSGGQMPA